MKAPRPVFLYLLAAVSAVTAVLLMIPVPEERDYLRRERSVADYLSAGCQGLKDEERRRGLFALLGELQEQGASRQLRTASRMLLGCGFSSPAETKDFLKLIFDDFSRWNTGFPRWKYEALKKYQGLFPPSTIAARSDPQDLSELFRRVPVTLVFRAAPGRYKRLWLKGNWNREGHLDALGGWEDLALSESGAGVWIRKELLSVTRSNDLYHAVVRTRPWPDGEAIGYARFRARSPMLVEIPRTAPPAPSPSSPIGNGIGRVGLSVLCLDGATWHAILPWVYRGKLPNFRRILQEGAVANLVSTGRKYGTVGNVYAALTGKVPNRLGLGESSTYQFLPGRKVRPLWAMASKQGQSSLVVGVLDAFPPNPIRGKMVTDVFYALELGKQKAVKDLVLGPHVGLFLGQFGFSSGNIRAILKGLGWIDGTVATTYPHSLEEDLRRALPRESWGDPADLTELVANMDQQFIQTVDHLTAQENFDLLSLYLCETDTASHAYWSDFEPQESLPYAIRDPRVLAAIAGIAASHDRLEKAYERADRLLGLLMARSVHTMVFSDHGFGSTGLNYLNLIFNLDKFLLAFQAESHLALPDSSEVSRDPQRDTLWLPAGEAGRIFAETFARRLRSCRYLPHGSPMFSRVETVSRGRSIKVQFVQEQPPQSIFINGVDFGGTSRSVMDFFDLSTLQGNHKGNGILAMIGPRIRRAKMEEAFIPDVAPTALYLLDLPVGRDMDGTVVAEAFPDGELERRPVRSIKTYGREGSAWLSLLRAVRWRKALARLWSELF